MIKQYVGARYVPKFYENSLNPLSNEWEENVNYEALTVVTYLNDSYTSKKPVPVTVGNPRNNSEYWSLTGAYNAQVEQYREEVIELSENVEIFEEATNNKIGDLEDLETEDKTSIVNAINSTLSSAKKYLFIGDSYAELSWGSWIDVTVEKLGINSNDYYEKHEGGAGFNRQGSGGHNYNALLNIAYGNIQNPEEITDIIVGSGVNDCYDEVVDGVASAIAEFVTNAKTKFPNAKIYLAFYGISTRSDINKNIPKTLENFININQYENCYFLPGVENVCHNAYWIGGGADRVHPNLIGLTAIGNAIADAYLNGFASCEREKLIGDSRNLQSKIYKVVQKDGQISLMINAAYILFEVNNITLHGIGNDDLHLTDMEFSFFSPTGKSGCKIPVMAQIVYNSAAAIKIVPGYIYFDYYAYSATETRQGLYFNMYNFSSSGVENLENVSKIYIMPFAFSTSIGEA